MWHTLRSAQPSERSVLLGALCTLLAQARCGWRATDRSTRRCSVCSLEAMGFILQSAADNNAASTVPPALSVKVACCGPWLRLPAEAARPKSTS